MARRPASLLCFLALVSAPLVAGALPVAILEVERSAQASASASDGVATAQDSVDLSDSAQGSVQWLTDAAVAPLLPAASSSGFPSYNAIVEDGEIVASAGAEVGATAGQEGAFAFGSAEVVQRIVFEATADAQLRLAGDLLAQVLAGTAGDSFALLEISSLGGVLDPNPLLIRRTAAPAEHVVFDLPFAVEAGVSYQILALARANADALDAGGASFFAGFTLELTEVPEASTAVLVALGAIALGARRARR